MLPAIHQYQSLVDGQSTLNLNLTEFKNKEAKEQDIEFKFNFDVYKDSILWYMTNTSKRNQINSQ